MNRSLALGALTLALMLSAGIGTAAATEDPTGTPGVGLQVRVTATPAPVVEEPPALPTGTSVAAARFPIELSGLDPFSYVEIFANSTPVLIASGFADANGRFETTVALPPNLAPGDHSISATNTTASGAKKSITIVKFAVTASGKIAAAGGATGSSSASARSSGASVGSAGEATVTTEELSGAAAEAALGPDPFAVGGSLWFGGFRAEVDYRNGILRPGLLTELVVRNVSSEPLTATAALRLRALLGPELAERSEIELATIEPGATQRVRVFTPNVGSWAFYDVALELAVPESKAALNRQLNAFVLPLPALMILFSLGLFGTIAAWLLNRAGVRLPRRRGAHAVDTEEVFA